MDIPEAQSFTRQTSESRATAQAVLDLPEGLTSQEIDLVQDFWPDLTPSERDNLLLDLRRVADARQQLANDIEAIERKKQIHENQGAIQLLRAWRAEAAAMDVDAAAAAEADWADLQEALNANRAPEPPLFP